MAFPVPDVLTERKSYYHVSKVANRDGIMAAGLELVTKEDQHIIRRPAVYVFDSLEHAVYYAHWGAVTNKTEMDVWEVRFDAGAKLWRDTHHEMREFGAWKHKEAVGASSIRLATTYPVKTFADDEPPFTPLPIDHNKRFRKPRQNW